MTTLNLTLRGLCGLVPNEFMPEEPDTAPFPISRMRVLVLDAVKMGESRNLSLCEHKPQLIIGPPGNTQTIDLELYTIGIEGLAADGPIQLQPDFWKVARMNQVTRIPFRIDDGFLANPPRDGLIASLQLTSGVATGINLSSRILDFQNDVLRPYRANFASAVQVLLRLDGPARISLTPFDDTAPVPPPIDLVPDSADAVHVTLTNLCDLPEDAPMPQDESADFATFFGLLPKYDGPLFVPLDAPTRSMRGEVRGEATRIGGGCVPAVFNAHPNA